MNRIFLQMLNISFQASWLILAVLILRLVLKKVPRWIPCLMWGMVAFRLMVPFRIESALSLIPSAEPVPVQIDRMSQPAVHSGIPVMDRAVNRVVASQFTPDPAASVNPLQIVVYLAAILWITGMIVLFVYALVSYVRLRRKVAASIQKEQNVYLCDEISSPFLFGIFRPRIYLPSDLPESYYQPVLLHEQAHLKRGDHIWKPLGFLLLCVYWMNPLCWAAYLLFCKDMELACDEKAVSRMNHGTRADYCQALLACCSERKGLTACPVAFGESGVKERVRQITRAHKPVFWVVAAALLLCGIVAVCFLTSPKTADSNENGSDQTSQNGNVTDLNWTVVNQWARAFCDRDGETIVSISTKEVQDALEEAGLLNVYEDGVSFGFSSPWPMWDEETLGYWAIEMEEQSGTARILYYAWTSDPHVTVWEEKLHFTEEGGKALVSEETLDYHEQIVSAEEYDEAYPLLNGTLMDYTVNGLGDALASSNQKGELSDPVQAVRILLNLSEDPNEVSISMLQDSSSVGIPVSITFVKEQEERKVLMVKLNDSIWVPQEYGTNMVENLDLLDRMDHIFADQLDDPMPWSDTVDWKADTDRLIQMAVDETGRYEVYGVYCGEYGTMGIIFNDTIDGTETNENTFYDPWVYTGVPQDEPKLAWVDGNLLFAYPVQTHEKNGETYATQQLAYVDCGYDTGHVEMVRFILADLEDQARALLKNAKELKPDFSNVTYDLNNKKVFVAAETGQISFDFQVEPLPESGDAKFTLRNPKVSNQ